MLFNRIFMHIADANVLTKMCICKGMGKSRIIATIVALKNEYDGTNKFTVVFTSELLKSVE